MGWIDRTIEARFCAGAPSGVLPVWLLLGPRQVGKSSVLLRCATEGRRYINLDDISIRMRAKENPELFARELTPPITIDEIQYAPQLLSVIKILADRCHNAGEIWLTGSQSFEVMRGIEESLAGRVAILNLFGLSDEEKGIVDWGPEAYFRSIAETTFPRLYGISDIDARAEYLAGYTQTYIERDVRELLGIEKRREFELFVRACALRTGQVVNYESFAQDVGVSPKTVKEWLQVLEDSFLISLVRPYHSNRTKRLIKSPKLYFLDMGLAAYLSGWRDSEMLRTGPMAGAAFETQVYGNILRFFRHRGRDVQIHFWRTRDGQEIDFLIETARGIHPVEVKLGIPKRGTLPALAAIRDAWQGGSVVSLAHAGPDTPALTPDWRLWAVSSLSAMLAAF